MIRVGDEVTTDMLQCRCCRDRDAHGRVVEVHEDDGTASVRWDDSGRVGVVALSDLEVSR